MTKDIEFVDCNDAEATPEQITKMIEDIQLRNQSKNLERCGSTVVIKYRASYSRALYLICKIQQTTVTKK